MKKLTIGIILILVLVIIVAGIYYYPESATPSQENISCGQNDYCWIDLAVKYKDEAYCKNVSGRYMSGNAPVCLRKVYIAKGDAASCGKLYYSDDRRECYYEISKDKENVCDSLSDLSKNECEAAIFIEEIIERAELTENQSICNELTGTYNIYPDLVENYSRYNESCLLGVFIAIGDINLCDQLEERKSSCIYQIQNQ
jgi:hypothetical protein